MSKNKYVVVGCNGQLGSELRRLSDTEAAQFAFYDYPDIDITNIAKIREVLEKEKPTAIINCAAFTAVDKAESEKEAAHKVNAEGVKNLAQAAEEFKAWLIHVSTDYVFDGKGYLPYVETDTPNPQSVYGSTKLEGEKFATAYKRAIVVRTAWLYSSFGNNFVKTMMRLGKERESLGVVFDQVGTPTYARDLAAAILAIASQVTKTDDCSKAGIYHFTNEGVASWYDFTRAIFDLCKIEACKLRPIETKDYPTPAQRPFYSVLNKSKIKSTFGIEIPYWKHSLQDCIKELNNN